MWNENGNISDSLGPTRMVLIKKASFFLAVVGLVAWMQPTTVAARNSNLISVTTAPDVRQAIDSADLPVRNRLNQAIKVGNKFAKLRFKTDDMYEPEIEKEWNKLVGPLIGMAGEEWQQMNSEWQTEVAFRQLNKKGSRNFLICPQVRLVDARLVKADVLLTYSAVFVGSRMKVYEIRLNDESIDKSRRGEIFEIKIVLGPQNRITNIEASEKIRPYIYSLEIEKIKWEIKNFGVIEDKDIPEKKRRLNALLPSLESAASICQSSNR